MLRELKKRDQIAGELDRRWFFCHEIDVVFWLNAEGKPSAFQLAYDKYRNEQAISWHPEYGFRHYAVDDGEDVQWQKSTPFLHENQVTDIGKALKIFEENVGDLPAELSAFVLEKLESYGI